MKKVKINDVHGCYFSIAAVIISLITLTTSLIILSITDSTMIILTEFMSYLGDGLRFANFLFNGGMLISSALFVIYYIFLSQYLYDDEIDKKEVLRAATISALICSIGCFIVGISPERYLFELHTLGAALTFIGGILLTILYGYYEFLIPNFDNRVAILSFITTSIPFLYLIFYSFSILLGFNPNITILFQWLSYYALMVWALVQAIYMLKFK